MCADLPAPFPSVLGAGALPNETVKSTSSETDPTVIVGLPVNFFVQPARFKSLFSNSGSQNRRVEQ